MTQLRHQDELVTRRQYDDAMTRGYRVAQERDAIRLERNRAEADRDRYRRALVEIVALPRPQLQTERTWREVALEALRDG